MSIALYEADRPVVGVVHDPVLGETFTAAAGEGARLNGEPIAVTDPKGLDEAILGLSFNPSPAVKQQVADMLGRVLPAIGDLRRIPAALNLAYLAVGRTNASVLVDAKIWDVAAGLVIAAEAGAPPGSRAEDLLVLAATAPLATTLTALVTPQ